MPKIKQLSLHEAQKIAAGEVVERPANIVKELVENALDAGSTAITIYIEDGGKRLIRIIDNGCGMDEIDAHMSIIKHATSKVSTLEDLQTIQTHGFRGEALASICAIARITLATKDVSSSQGIRLTIENSTIISQEAVAHTTGTDISVADLFYTIPARKKFLKSRDTEWHHIHQLLIACALDYPMVQFTLYHDNKQIFHCKSTQSMGDRIRQLFEQDIAESMILIENKRTHPRMEIDGFISPHTYNRYDRNEIYFFVNNRWVKNHTLATALIKGYKQLLPPRKYPIAVVSISIDPHMVDINIHPRKEEVKFLHPRIIEDLIQQAVTQALEKTTSSHITASSQAHNDIMQHRTNIAPFSFLTNIQRDPFVKAAAEIESTPNFSAKTEQFFVPSQSPIPHQNNTRIPASQPMAIPLVSDTQQSLHQVHDIPEYRLIGQYNNTYLLIEEPTGLYIIDQHAAHERVLYEQFNKRFDQVPTINLMFPEIITLSQNDYDLLLPHLDIFHTHAITIEPCGSQQLIVTSTPVYLKSVSCEQLVQEVVTHIKESDTIDTEQLQRSMQERLRAQMACKAAVKAGDILTTEQMIELLKDLHKTENRFACPHGRPTGFLLSMYEIEKKFKRRL